MKNNLKLIRKKRHLTLKQLAAICGTSTSFLCELENQSGSSPTLTKARKIAETLGKTVNEIWPEE